MKKTMMITGASSGFGRATANLFHQRGWNVIATMRSPEKETELSKLDDLLLLALDVTDTKTIDAAIKTGLDRFGRIDVLINNAGHGSLGVIDVTKAILPVMRRQRSGIVINEGRRGVARCLVFRDRSGNGLRLLQTRGKPCHGIRQTTNADSLIRKKHIVKVNFPGGIVPAGDLQAITAAALSAGCQAILFGGRQQLLVEVLSDRLPLFMTELTSKGLFVEVDADTYPNIMSSCVAEQMAHTGSWLKEGVYKDVLEAFNALNYRPRLTVNLVDQGQTLVPFNTGRLNFIASGIGNYWHLLLRLNPKSVSDLADQK